MLRFALIVALTIGGTAALAQKDRKEAIKEAKEKAKEKAKDAKKDKKAEEHGKAGEDHGKGKDAEHGKDGEGGVDKDGKGKATTLEAETAKHARRLERIANVEAKAKAANRPELLERVAAMRDKETKRHEKALARLAKKGGAK